MSYDLQEAKEAATRLAREEDAVAAYRVLDEVIAKAGRLPVKIIGERLSWTNPLLYTYREAPEMFKTMMVWANDKRKQRGLTPLFRVLESFDKTEYMRDFMAQIRVRQRRAVSIENSKRPERDALRGEARARFVRTQGAKWKVRRDALLDAMRQANGGHALSKPEMQEALAAFWKGIDAELDDLEKR